MIRHGTNQTRPVYTEWVDPYKPIEYMGRIKIDPYSYCAILTSRTGRIGAGRIPPTPGRLPNFTPSRIVASHELRSNFPINKAIHEGHQSAN